MRSASSHKILSVLLVFCILISGCARNSKSLNSSASSLETELGNAIHQQILQTALVYQEQGLNEYVQNIGYRIAAQAHRKGLAYRFVILQDDRIYATFAPGGYVYVTTGFFRFLKSEIELAGILAYEIAALQYQDPRLSRLKKSFELVLRTGSYVAPAFGAIGTLSVIGLALVGAATSREKSYLKRVEEADQKAIQYLFQSGYDPQGLLDPLYRMSDVRSPERAYLYDYLQSHPIDETRTEKLNAGFQKLSLENKQFEAGRALFLAKTELVRNTLVRKS